MTLALYLQFLISTGRNNVYLPAVLADFEKIEKFAAFAEANKEYKFSEAILIALRQGRKIIAIKEIRATHPDNLGLKEAKDLVDKWVQDHPTEYNSNPISHPYGTY